VPERSQWRTRLGSVEPQQSASAAQVALVSPHTEQSPVPELQMLPLQQRVPSVHEVVTAWQHSPLPSASQLRPPQHCALAPQRRGRPLSSRPVADQQRVQKPAVVSHVALDVAVAHEQLLSLVQGRRQNPLLQVKPASHSSVAVPPLTAVQRCPSASLPAHRLTVVWRLGLKASRDRQ
jgi:hypothetical protein